MAHHLAEPDAFLIKIEPPYDAEIADWPFNAIKACLNDQASLVETVEKLAVPIDDLYIKFLKTKQNGQTKLAQLIVDLRNRTSPSRVRSPDDLLWSKLQIPECRYSYAAAEVVMNSEDEYHSQYEPEGLELGLNSVKEEWTRHNAFLARLLTMHDAYAIYERYALLATQSALEEDDKTSEDSGRNVPAAAIWVLYAGEHIYRSRRESLERCTPAEGCPLWNGKKGFCPERRALWKERLEWVAEQDGMVEKARDLAVRPFSKMKETKKALG